MAFSMLLRTPGYTSRLYTQQMMKLATQASLQRSAVSVLPATANALKEMNTPILNSVRSFRTSPVRLSDEKPHDHSKLWVIEKGVAALMVPILPLGLLLPNKILDSVIAILICAHSFWGLEAMVVEYIRVLLFGAFIPKVAMGIVYFVSVTMLGGLFYLIFNDIGLCRAFWRIWRNMRKPSKSGGSGGGGKKKKKCT
ncbi:succinate dehydrogenase [ubiquinone] cytochrome b small subunit, mitochondrial isoform X1 [Trichoplusia ni]|uniref:Succinate dehydrogenase [ubiquinone] cytochrome b small subunit n=1 Tax=Trichoplusia ni TaxID=7111 RepID=A0A7E5WQK4_TRINI|nr:succinate dehydrogenase [ubiquinone] cytochrome b small subunit, mitochondrial isoform X1 [Trichoplusia ni]